MKVFIALILAIGSASARGSGPYLPSGWKPSGPAFYLPSEVAKPAPAPVQVSLLQESEASSSDAFREYGPPKLEEVSISVNQVLPDVATEKTFLTAIKNEEVAVAVQETANVEANVEQAVAIVEEVSTATESAVSVQVEEQATEISTAQPTADAQLTEVLDQAVEISDAVQLEEVKEEIVPTAAVEELNVPTVTVVEDAAIPIAAVLEEAVPTVAVVEAVPTVAVVEVVPTVLVVEDVAPTAAVVEDVVSTAVVVDVDVPTVAVEEVIVPLAQQELVQEAVPTAAAEGVVEKVVEGVASIAEAIVNLEKEVKAVEVQAIEKVEEITSVQEGSGSLDQAPEGFLEYGPPGFAEYGPPKQEDLARLAVEVASDRVSENNEVRRRRYSPKFRSTRKH